MISPGMKDLILKMLEKNPETRITLPMIKVRDMCSGFQYSVKTLPTSLDSFQDLVLNH